MEDIKDIINRITKEVTASYESPAQEARAAMGIFLLGCYCSKHKPFLEKARDEIINRGIVCMLMEDVKHKELDIGSTQNYAIKFRLMCDTVLKSFRVPLIFMYASTPEINCKSGANLKLVTICENPKYEKLKGSFRIFSEKEANLPHHHLSILFNASINNGEEFIVSALKRLEIEINTMVDIFTRDGMNGGIENGKLFK